MSTSSVQPPAGTTAELDPMAQTIVYCASGGPSAVPGLIIKRSPGVGMERHRPGSVGPPVGPWRRVVHRHRGDGQSS